MSSDPIAGAVALLERGDWQGAHAIVQDNGSLQHAAWAHGIVHILEGDLSNARYWYAKAKRAFPDPASPESELRLLKAALALC